MYSKWLKWININGYFLFQGKESENISLADVDAELCPAADAESCITVALNIIREIEFIDQPVHSLLLTVQVRNNNYTYARKLMKSHFSSA